VGSIPDDIIGIFNLLNPSSRIMALRSTQPIREMSARNLPGGKGWLVCKAKNCSVIQLYRRFEGTYCLNIVAYLCVCDYRRGTD
jgi:hypothetical protein